MPRKVKNGKKYALGIILNFIWMFILYRAAIFLSEHFESSLFYIIISAIYLIAASVLLALFYAKTTLAETKEQKDKYKMLAVFGFPLVIVLLLDVGEAIILDYIINLYK